MEQFSIKDRYNLEDLVALVALLRDPVLGCNWDREQTHESIRMNFIEEVYEAAEAIDTGDSQLLLEELGDVLLQVLLHAEMERQAGRFGMDEVADRLCKKLVLRHPHLFGQVKVDGSEDVLANWEQIKREEKQQRSGSDAIRDVPLAMPALMRTQKILKRAAYAGYGSRDADSALDAAGQALAQLREPQQVNSDKSQQLGALLLAATDIALQLKLDAEQCAELAADEFAWRFIKMEQLADEEGLDLRQLKQDELQQLYRRAGELV